jgi:hypothetical protein
LPSNFPRLELDDIDGTSLSRDADRRRQRLEVISLQRRWANQAGVFLNLEDFGAIILTGIANDAPGAIQIL